MTDKQYKVIEILTSNEWRYIFRTNKVLNNKIDLIINVWYNEYILKERLKCQSTKALVPYGRGLFAI